jgi:hypothetical protein
VNNPGFIQSVQLAQVFDDLPESDRFIAAGRWCSKLQLTLLC